MLNTIAALLPLTVAFSNTPIDAAEMVKQIKPATAHLQILDQAGNELGTGTGFFVFDNGWIATNHHVIDGAVAVRAILADGRQLEVQGVLATSVEDDLALIKVDGAGFPRIALGASADLVQGDKVFVVGGPLGLAGSLSEGIVSAFRDEGVEEGYEGAMTGPRLQITAAIAPGSSGSPVVSSRGEVIGVAVSGFTNTQSLNFAVPVDRLKALIKTVDPAATPKPFSNALFGNLSISAVVLLALALLLWFNRRGTRSPPRKRAKRARGR
ncbi:MAG: S1C family serine protease [Myxococcota bacterium]